MNIVPTTVLMIILLSGALSCTEVKSANESFNISYPYGVPCITWQSADGMTGGLDCDWSKQP